MLTHVELHNFKSHRHTQLSLADRILVEKIDWLEDEQLQYVFRWSGLQENTEHSCWKDINKIVDNFKQSLGFRRYLPLL